MIRRLTAIAIACLAGADASAQEEPEEQVPEEEEDPLSPYRTSFDVLADRTIGTASKPVAFDWRRTQAQIALTGTFMFELNTFNSMRIGGLARLPTGSTLVEVGVNYAHPWDTTSSRALALTPYRQAGRPSRLELDLGFALPLAEGVVTAAPKFFPAAQLVFNVHANFRYMVYPTGWGGMTTGQVLGAILTPRMTDIEVANLDEERLAAMAVDRGRYAVMVGFSNDLYFKQGIFLSPRLMLAVPILAPVSETDLLLWAEFTLAAGVAF